jgi:hypothetical protein
MPVWAANTGMGMPKPVLTPITPIVPPLLGPLRTSFGNLCKLVLCSLVRYVLDPKNTNTSTDPHTRNGISSTDNGNLRVLVPTYMIFFLFLFFANSVCTPTWDFCN